MRRVSAKYGCPLVGANFLFFTLHRGMTRYHGTQGSSTTSEADALNEGPTAAPGMDHGNTSPPEESETSKSRIRSSAVKSVMEKAASARRDIFDLWRTTSELERNYLGNRTTPNEKDESAGDQTRILGVARILETYHLTPSTPREEDVCRGLGDALDRLLLLCVPFSNTVGTTQLEQILHLTGRLGRKLSVRTVQHLFSRTNSYAEALAVFYALRRCNFSMNMETYHAMMYSLQRLEEEGWAIRFHDDYVQSRGESLSEQALDFVLSGINNQLLPENKPWLGRIMFSDVNDASAARQTQDSFDELGKLWLDRYREGE
ncbi:unnamed protein product [Phytomonas sp. Hart1]|nr:unnamed protein product [Phytomonas sp. Hart1]|eukprot:CCW68617.1 unnamed protein product [Phytomonas sp. isolate Hart1]